MSSVFQIMYLDTNVHEHPFLHISSSEDYKVHLYDLIAKTHMRDCEYVRTTKTERKINNRQARK